MGVLSPTTLARPLAAALWLSVTLLDVVGMIEKGRQSARAHTFRPLQTQGLPPPAVLSTNE